MRRPGLLLRVTVLLVSAVAAAAAVLVFDSRPHLQDARVRVDRGWAALRPTLDDRYDALADAADACRDRLGADRPLLDQVERAVAAWRAAGRRPVEAQVRLSNELEGLAVRLSATVAATPRLRSSDEVGDALEVLAGVDGMAAGEVRAYNDAVRAYEDIRGGFPRRLVAGALGFDTRRTLELPA